MPSFTHNHGMDLCWTTAWLHNPAYYHSQPNGISVQARLWHTRVYIFHKSPAEAFVKWYKQHTVTFWCLLLIFTAASNFTTCMHLLSFTRSLYGQANLTDMMLWIFSLQLKIKGYLRLCIWWSNFHPIYQLLGGLGLAPKIKNILMARERSLGKK